MTDNLFWGVLRTEISQIVLKSHKSKIYIWHFARLIVPLASPKVVTLGKTQTSLVFRSLNRTFVPAN